ncbi:MAG TPA: hypothetical protein VK815_18120 [Candidatus Acidoferrales bacterium]|jgi:hypothetical protein|nr:hypothetical protein [Candidatus Acidoferrales bacterium]
MGDHLFKIKLEATGNAADEVKALNKEMGVVIVTAEDVSKATGKTGEAAEMSHRSFRHLAHTLGHEIPGAAALMEAGFEGSTEPMMGATFLLIAGIEMLRTAIEKVNKEQAESKKIGEALNDLDGERSKAVEKTRDALDEAETAEAVFYHNFIRNTEDAIGKASALAQAILKTRTGTGEANDSASKGIAEKNIEDMEQHGVISHASALKMKEQLDIEYEQRKLVRMIAQDAVEREILINQFQNKSLDVDKDGRAEKSAEERFKAATAAKVQSDTKLEEAQHKIAGGEGIIKDLRATGVTDENIDKLRTSYERVSGKPAMGKGAASLEDQFHYLSTHWIGTETAPQDYLGTQGDANLAMYEGAQIDVASGKFDLARLQKNKPDLDTGAALAKSDLEAARQRMEADRKEAQALKDKIAESDATNALKEGGAKSDLGMRRASGELMADRGIADRVQAGGAVSGAEQQKIIADASRIAGHTVDLKTAAQIIEHGAKNIGAFMEQVSRLSAVLGQFGPAQTENLQRQIDELRGKIKTSRNDFTG